LIARILLGGLTGACVASAGGEGIVLGTVLGIVGALAGTLRRISGAHETGGGARNAGLRDCPLGRPCDDWWVAMCCFAVLNFPALNASSNQKHTVAIRLRDQVVFVMSRAVQSPKE
jgi:uncharacterized membrane protein